MDVFERTAYNGFLSGVSVSGDRFFYPNPLVYDGQKKNNKGGGKKTGGGKSVKNATPAAAAGNAAA